MEKLLELVRNRKWEMLIYWIIVFILIYVFFAKIIFTINISKIHIAFVVGISIIVYTALVLTLEYRLSQKKLMWVNSIYDEFAHMQIFLDNNNLILETSDLHHIKTVMRNVIGDQIEVIYDNEIYLCTIENIEPLKLKIENVYVEDREIPLELTIAVGLVNEQKFDLILQKLTELGVSTIIPLKMERSIVKLDDNKMEKKIIRWEKICKEASEQSHRTKIPTITKAMTIKELEQNTSELKLVCSLSNNSKPLDEYLKNDLKSILFVIGPEGGISPKEEEQLISQGFKTTTLGKRVLRVETAAIYVTGIINYVYKG